jgi:hypothetical protein
MQACCQTVDANAQEAKELCREMMSSHSPAHTSSSRPPDMQSGGGEFGGSGGVAAGAGARVGGAGGGLSLADESGDNRIPSSQYLNAGMEGGAGGGGRSGGLKGMLGAGEGKRGKGFVGEGEGRVGGVAGTSGSFYSRMYELMNVSMTVLITSIKAPLRLY